MKPSYKQTKEKFKIFDFNLQDKCNNVIIASKLSVKKPKSNFNVGQNATTRPMIRSKFQNKMYHPTINFNYDRKSKEINMTNNDAVVKMKNMPKIDFIADKINKHLIINQSDKCLQNPKNCYQSTDRKLDSYLSNKILHPKSRFKLSEEIHRFNVHSNINKIRRNIEVKPVKKNKFIDNLSLLNRNKCFEDGVKTPRSGFLSLESINDSGEDLLINKISGKLFDTEDNLDIN